MVSHVAPFENFGCGLKEDLSTGLPGHDKFVPQALERAATPESHHCGNSVQIGHTMQR